MQRQIINSNRGRPGHNTGSFGAVLAMAGLLLLSACDSNDTVTENNLPEPGKDGVPPVLTTVTIEPDGLVEVGDSVRIDFTASEALMTPVVFINDVQAEVSGKISSWNAVREITDADPLGDVTFSIVYQDVSGELGQAVTTTTNDSVACIGADCVTDEPRVTRSGSVFPTRAPPGRGPACSTISTHSVPTDRSGTSRARKPSWSRGKASPKAAVLR